MKEYIFKMDHQETESIAVCFNIEEDTVFEIGEQMNEINEDAYMNGYNWEAFLNYYLEKNNPDILSEMDSDPEAGMFVAYFEKSPENELLADGLISIIKNLIENKSVLLEIVEKEGSEIEWD